MLSFDGLSFPFFGFFGLGVPNIFVFSTVIEKKKFFFRFEIRFVLRVDGRDDGRILCGSAPGSSRSPRSLLIISGHPSVIALIGRRCGCIYYGHQPTAQYP